MSQSETCCTNSMRGVQSMEVQSDVAEENRGQELSKSSLIGLVWVFSGMSESHMLPGRKSDCAFHRGEMRGEVDGGMDPRFAMHRRAER